METLAERLPDIITAAAQSHLGILALLSIALAILAYFFFARASEKARVGIFVLLFVGVIAFGTAMFRVSAPGTGEGTITTGAGNSSVATAAAPAPLSREAETLLKEASLDPAGLVLFERYGASVDLHTNGTSLFTDKADRRQMALWESALQELVDQKLLTTQGERGEVFEITKRGYEVADRIEPRRSATAD